MNVFDFLPMSAKTCAVCCTLFLALLFHQGKAQNCNDLRNDRTIIFNADDDCAPANVTQYDITFNFNNAKDPNTVRIIYTWNDPANTVTIRDISSGADFEALNANRSFRANATFVYPANEACFFRPNVVIEVDGEVCESSRQEQIVFSWDTDEEFGGQLALAPDPFRVCFGDPVVNAVFDDNSIFNCNLGANPPEIANRQSRTVQYVYGTNHNPATAIRNLTATLDGGVIRQLTDATGNLVPPLVNILGQDVIVLDAPITDLFPSDGPFSASRPMDAPADPDNLVGFYFEVTLFNWNVCNPYNGDAMNPNYGEAIQTEARIVIVEEPAATFITAKNDGGFLVPAGDFCIGDLIFIANITVTQGDVDNFRYRFYNGLDTTAAPILDINRNNTAIFSALPNPYFNPGTNTIRLTVRSDNNNSICEGEYLVTINVTPTDIAQIITYDEDGDAFPGNSPEFCQLVGGSEVFQVVFEDNTLALGPGGTFNAATRWRWEMEDENGNIVRRVPVQANPGAFDRTNDANYFTAITKPDTIIGFYTNPGTYLVRLFTYDGATDCDTFDEVEVHVYEDPVAQFDVGNACLGIGVQIEDQSTVLNVNGNEIAIWEWDFNYDGVTFNVERTDNTDPGTFIYNGFAAAGDYDIALRVFSSRGICESMVVQSVTVFEVPDAAFVPDEIEGCPDLTINFTNSSNHPAGLLIDRYEWYVKEGGSPTYQLVATQDPSELDFQFTFTNPTTLNKRDSIFLRSVADNGCFLDSDTVQILIFTAPPSEFLSDYDPIADNCSPLTLNFEPTAATKLLDPDTYTWRVIDEVTNTELFNLTRAQGEIDFEVFQYTFINITPTFRRFIVRMEPEKAGVCIAPSQQIFRVNPQPSSAFTITLLEETCDLIRYRIEATAKGMADYDWTFNVPPVNEASIIFDDDFEVIYQKPAPGNLDLNVQARLVTTNASNCPSVPTIQPFVVPAQEEITVNVVIQGTDQGCPPLVADFINQTAGAPAGTIYDLIVRRGLTLLTDEEIQAGLSGDLESNFSFEFIQTGTYQVDLRATGPDGCTSFLPNPLVVTVGAVPDVSFNITSSQGCAPFEVAFNEIISGDFTDYTWRIEDLSDNSTVLNQVNQPLSLFTFQNASLLTKEFQVSLEVVNAAGCSDIAVDTIRVFPQPNVSFEIEEGDVCAPYEFVFRNTSINNPGALYIWNWGDGTITSSNDTLVAHTFINNSFNNTRTFNVRLEVQTAEGCTETFTQPITVQPRVSAIIEAIPPRGCAPLQVDFNNISLGNSPSLSAWYVRLQGETTATQFSTASFPSITLENTGNDSLVYVIIYVARNAGGCLDSASRFITVYPEVEANFSSDQVLESCNPFEATFQNLSIREGVRYVWNWGDGEPNDTTYLESSISHTFVNPSAVNSRLFSVTLTARDTISGCEVFQRQNVRVYPAIVSRIAVSDSLGCAPLSVDFNNTSLGASSHSWQVSIQGEQGILEESLNPNFSYLFENNGQTDLVYLVSYRGSNVFGCVIEEEYEITVFPEINASFTASPERQILPDATVSFDNTSSAGPWIFEWDFGDGRGTSGERNPPPYTYQTYGEFTISLRVRGDECEDTFTQRVVIEPIVPIVDFDYDPASGCAPLTVTFTNLSQFADPDSYLWDFGDGQGSSRAANPVYTYLQPGTYTVTLEASNVLGTRVVERKELIIRVFPRPRASFQISPAIVYLPDDPLITQNLSVGASTYLWDFGDGSTSTEFQPRHFYTQPGIYDITLVATSPEGCADTFAIRNAVRVIEGGRTLIPNAFTPSRSGPSGGNINMDGGRNMVFFPITESVTDFHMLIYNRWGELLFESKNKEIGWDGYTRDGRLCPPDVYVYKINVTYVSGEREVRVGDVTLLR